MLSDFQANYNNLSESLDAWLHPVNFLEKDMRLIGQVCINNCDNQAL